MMPGMHLKYIRRIPWGAFAPLVFPGIVYHQHPILRLPTQYAAVLQAQNILLLQRHKALLLQALDRLLLLLLQTHKVLLFKSGSLGHTFGHLLLKRSALSLGNEVGNECLHMEVTFAA